ncbi:MAG: type II toxin-antitoxin system prevent-host-death family antitoxin [Candidatus Nitrotoga sp.]|nr:type II toxin-antitoxin system prevent-host-death family antitoxin [Candidatus Nitrotoga sp.]MDP1854481.1 type II toxin-antitoxin system prevent-host-death family antitoxin [Candidatus Nitrotoga sp.]
MEQLLVNRSVSITELKRSPSAIIEQAGDEAVAVLNHNRPAAYLVPTAMYMRLMAALEAATLREAIATSRRNQHPPIPIEQMFSEMNAAIDQVAIEQASA